MMTADANDSAFKHPWTPLTVVAPALVRNRDFHFWFLTRSKSDSPHTSPNRARCRRLAAKKSFYRQVFINIGPVDLAAIPDQFIIAELLRTGVQQSRVPGEWDTDRATIAQSLVPIVAVKLDVGNRSSAFLDKIPHAKLQLWYRQCLYVFIFSERFWLL